jgi:hypothetical protein
VSLWDRSDFLLMLFPTQRISRMKVALLCLKDQTSNTSTRATSGERYPVVTGGAVPSSLISITNGLAVLGYGGAEVGATRFVRPAIR